MNIFINKMLAAVSAIVLTSGSLLPLGSVSAAGTNLVANPGFETAAGAAPANWSSDSWGTNTAKFVYDTTGHAGSRAGKLTVSGYKSGDAKWFFTPVTVTPGHTYTFSNWYKSGVASGLDAAITTTAGTDTYQWIADVPASTTWKQQTFSFTAPANAKSVTFYHYLTKNGTLSVDDYSLTDNAGTTTPPTNAAPAVNLTAPANLANLSGTTNVTANASDDKAVANVQFKLDGANLGAADTTAPYSTSWDTKTATKGVHSLTAVATDSEGLATTATAVSVNVDNTSVTPTPPTVTMTAPAVNAVVSGKTQSVSAEASDSQGITSVQFKLDGANLGATDTTAPYGLVWDTTTVANGAHAFEATATNKAGLTSTSYQVPVTVNNVTTPPANVAPTVTMTAPAANATVSGTAANVTANASDDKAVANVQFKLDGANLGAADTTAPYSIAWNTTTVANGSHSLTAVATDSDGLTTTSTAVPITVNNVTTPPAAGNLIANPSVETATGNVPNSWTNDSWGTNTHAFSYEANGQDGTRSVKTTVSAYTSGDAKWYFTPVAATAGSVYNYSEYYKSDITTEVDAMVTLNDGTVAYYWLGSPAAASNWTKLNYQFTAPANAKNVTIFHVVAAKGYVQSDNFSLTKQDATSNQLTRGLVSLTFDDGWRNIYTNGLPALQKYGLPSTQYLNSTPIVDGYPDYMTYQMVKDFKTQGSELAWHTRTHADVTTLTAANLTTELTIPQAFLTGTGTTAAEFKNFATPYGAYNASSVAAIMQKYQSHRSTDVGYNGKTTFDITNIKVQNITNTTTPADVQAWVNQAIANKTWLVIVYHEVTATAADPTYAVTPANLDSELNIVKQSGVTVKTVDQAIAEVKSQL